MRTSKDDQPRAVDVRATAHELVVLLIDGRTLHVPLSWFPKLRAASLRRVRDFRPIGRGIGIQWPQLDEDLSIKRLLAPRADALRRKTA